MFRRSERRYPMLRYPWAEVRAALDAKIPLTADTADLTAALAFAAESAESAASVAPAAESDDTATDSSNDDDNAPRRADTQPIEIEPIRIDPIPGFDAMAPAATESIDLSYLDGMGDGRS